MKNKNGSTFCWFKSSVRLLSPPLVSPLGHPIRSSRVSEFTGLFSPPLKLFYKNMSDNWRRRRHVAQSRNQQKYNQHMYTYICIYRFRFLPRIKALIYTHTHNSCEAYRVQTINQSINQSIQRISEAVLSHRQYKLLIGCKYTEMSL